ncbi:MAG: hypothetical protein A9957_04275 [Methanohalophilus sp. DAL1]|uniref:Uncharacterized protein n=1 Tax=Methanohalophilus euhalobius TaxID=51203 RepID=A0A3M9L5P3_9EURY|nr:MAG: hypothetical protein A9957_04275 [Methanohalophilus sp. DAL1]RNI08632.1 hypothetical protein EDD83_05945 [Methanohalophilus euhalobius]
MLASCFCITKIGSSDLEVSLASGSDVLLESLFFLYSSSVNYHPLNRVASCFIALPIENNSTGSPRSSYGASNTYQILFI